MNPKSPNRRTRTNWIAIIVLFGMAAGFASQNTINPPQIHVESALVTVPVMVSDSRGRFLPGLSAGAFSLYQDGISVPISIFLTSEDPIKIALLLDTSVSTLTVLGKIKRAADRFLLQMRSGDLAMVASFDSDIRVLCPLTSDKEKLRDAIKNAQSRGSGTKMRDAINEIAQRKFRAISGRKAVVLLTDGEDHGSEISAQGLLDSVAASSTLIYSVFYSVDPRELMKELVGRSSRIPKAAADRKSGPYTVWQEREDEAAQYLEKISELSAGRFYRSNIKELDGAFKQISEELRSQYLIGFYPDKSKLDGNMHTLVVGVAVPEAVVRSRRSYRAVSE